MLLVPAKRTLGLRSGGAAVKLPKSIPVEIGLPWPPGLAVGSFGPVGCPHQLPVAVMMVLGVLLSIANTVLPTNCELVMLGSLSLSDAIPVLLRKKLEPLIADAAPSSTRNPMPLSDTSKFCKLAPAAYRECSGCSPRNSRPAVTEGAGRPGSAHQNRQRIFQA